MARRVAGGNFPMILARVDGVIVSTVSHPSMHGHRTIICQPLDEKGRDDGTPILALDPHGAGRHQRVLISTDGSHTRGHVKDPKSPLRNIILGIIDDDDVKASHSPGSSPSPLASSP